MTGLLYDLLFALPFSLAVTSVSGALFKTEGGLLSVFLTVAVTLICAILKSTKAIWRIIILPAAAAAIALIYFMQPAGERIALWHELSGAVLMMAISVVLFLISVLLDHFKKVRLTVAAAGALFLAASLFAGLDVTKLCVCTILLYALLVLTDHLNGHVVFIAPFLLVFFVAVAFVKVPEEPYDWGFVYAICDSVKSAGVYIRENMLSDNPWNGSKTVIGFSDRGALGGDLYGSKRKVMELLSQNESDPKLYLAGKTFDTFDGREWYKNDSGEFTKESFDVIETMCAAEDVAGEGPLSDIVKRSWLKVRYRDMHTGVMFYPAKAVFESADMETVGEEGGDLSFLDRRDSRVPYDMIYYRVNRDSADFERMLSGSHEITEADWKEAARMAGIKENDVPPFSDYLKYRSMIREEYLSEVVLSDRLSVYMGEILKGADTDYEKLKRIEQSLKDFTYTDSPGDLPESIGDGSDYLDYLFFEKKSGYCSYFATAFVLLARANDIPARYVQGYCVPMGIARRVDVSSVMAHAWPEAYIEGVGWIAFEPTPGMDNSAGWITSDGEDRSVTAESAEADRDALQESDEPGKVGESEGHHIRISTYTLLASVLAAMAVILLLALLIRVIIRVRYAGMDDRGKALWLCRRNMELLKKIKPGRAGHETLMEYGSRLSDSVPVEHLLFLQMYEHLLYADYEVTEADRIILEEAHRRLLIYVRKTRLERIRRIIWQKKRVSLA